MTSSTSSRSPLGSALPGQSARPRRRARHLLGEGEQVAPLPAARVLHRGIPGSRLRVIPNAGHLPFLEQPAAFNAARLEFLGEVE